MRLFRLQPTAAYALGDLAAEAIGLLDALGIAQAHVCGMSMGGMVAQRLALAAPQRVLSLTLMMSSSGSPWLPRPDHRVMQRMFVRPLSATNSEGLVAHFVELHRPIGSSGYPKAMTRCMRVWPKACAVRIAPRQASARPWRCSPILTAAASSSSSTCRVQ